MGKQVSSGSERSTPTRSPDRGLDVFVQGVGPFMASGRPPRPAGPRRQHIVAGIRATRPPCPSREWASASSGEPWFVLRPGLRPRLERRCSFSRLGRSLIRSAGAVPSPCAAASSGVPGFVPWALRPGLFRRAGVRSRALGFGPVRSAGARLHARAGVSPGVPGFALRLAIGRPAHLKRARGCCQA